MKSPAFQFYPTDYIASQRVQMLTLEEEGAYIRLLCYCWQHGCIPNNPEQLARLIGKGASTTLATTVATMFQPSKDGERLVHDRLEAERAKQTAWREKSAEGGRKSSEKRKGGSTVVQPPHQPKGNIPFPSPSSELVVVVKEAPAGDGILLESEVVHAEPFWQKATGWQGISAEHRKRWSIAYPACNIDRQLAQMHEWLLAHPKESNKSNWPTFVTNWLKNEQNRGGDSRADRKTTNANNSQRNSRWFSQGNDYSGITDK